VPKVFNTIYKILYGLVWVFIFGGVGYVAVCGKYVQIMYKIITK
jgi:hypothetical protein